MSPPEDLYPPVTHGAVWPVVAWVALALVAVWWIALWWRTRPPRDRTPVWRPLHGRALAARRATGLAAVDAVVAAYEAGETSTREAFQRLSPLVRGFVFDAAGIPAHTMTLSVLETEHPGAVADVIALMYPAEFAAVVDGDVRRGAERAREVVLGWDPERAAATTGGGRS